MSKQNEWEREAPVTDARTDPNDQYRWSYEGQRAYESARDRRQKKRGATVYAVTMAVAFLCCFAILLGVLAIFKPHVGGALGTSVANAAEAILPATVLITGIDSDGYSYGTGFFIRQDGFVVTNYHVVAGRETVSVTLYGTDRMLPAMLVGYSVADDLAVIRISGDNYPTVTVGNSNAVRVGDTTVAVGNPTGPTGAWTTTSGIVSSVDRTISITENGMHIDMHMLQTDAALNSGNSGGPLCNDRGEVIGIVTRKYNDAEGIGLAIPINGAMPLINAIIQTGSAEGVTSTVSRSRPLLGITGQNVKGGQQFEIPSLSSYASQPKKVIAPRDGIAVLTVDLSIPVAVGLRAGDVIFQVDGESCTTVEQLADMLYGYAFGDWMTLTLMRDGKEKEVRCRFAAPN